MLILNALKMIRFSNSMCVFQDILTLQKQEMYMYIN